MDWYGQYKGRSLGRILKFLYRYCGLHVAEVAQANKAGGMDLHGRPFCEVVFDDNDVPTFTFLPGNDPFHPKKHLYYEEQQRALCAEILEEERRTALKDRHKAYADLHAHLVSLQQADEDGEWFTAMMLMNRLQGLAAELGKSIKFHRCMTPKKEEG